MSSSKRIRLVCNKCPSDGKTASNETVVNQISNKMRISQLIQASSQNRRLGCLPGQTNSKIVFYPINLNIFGRLDTPGGTTASTADLGQPLNGGSGSGCAARGGSLPIKNF